MSDNQRHDAESARSSQPEEKPGLMRVRAGLLGVVYGALMFLCSAPLDLWWVGLVAPLPLVWLAMRPKMAPSRAGFWAAIGTSPWWAISHWWVADVSVAGVVPLVIYLSFWAMAFVWIGGRVSARSPGWVMASLPVVWVGLEYLRGSVLFTGYAWFLAGHPMMDSPGSGLAYPAAFGGAYLVSWLVLVGVCGVAVLKRGGEVRSGMVLARVGLLVWAGWLGVGLTLWRGGGARDSGGASIKVAVVQSNVPQSNKSAWTFTQRYLDWLDLRELTIEAAAANPDLIVWPETMFPGLTLDAASVDEEERADLVWPIERGADPRLVGVGDFIGATTVAYELLALQRGLGIPIVVGAPGYTGLKISIDPDGKPRFDWDAQYNSVFLLRGGEALDTNYRKMRLMAFGEVMPYLSRWPWLEKQLLAIGANGMRFTLSEGTQATRFDLQSGARAVTPICFEATMPSICRRLVYQNGQRRAGVMINPSNDGWFGNSVAMRENYLRTARWRCVELGTPMVRACNTGISVGIDSRGRTLPSLSGSGAGVKAMTAGVLVVDVPLGRGITVYGRVGDVFGAACGVGVLILCGIIAVGGVNNRKMVKNPVECEPEE